MEESDTGHDTHPRVVAATKAAVLMLGVGYSPCTWPNSDTVLELGGFDTNQSGSSSKTVEPLGFPGGMSALHIICVPAITSIFGNKSRNSRPCGHWLIRKVLPCCLNVDFAVKDSSKNCYHYN